MANDLNIVGVDGNPQVMDRMIELDSQRSLDNNLMENSKVCPKPTNPGLDLVDKDRVQGDKDLTPLKNMDERLPDHLETDQETDWSKIGPRKKRKSRKK